VPDVVALVQEVNCLKNETVELKASLSRAVADLRKELDAIRRGVRSIRLNLFVFIRLPMPIFCPVHLYSGAIKLSMKYLFQIISK